MTRFAAHIWSFRAAPALALALILGACTGISLSSHDDWYASNDLAQPVGDTVRVCHAFGCMMKTPVHFSAGEMSRITAPLARKASSAAAERQAVSVAVQRFETIVGTRLGTSADLGGFEKVGGGDPTQMDCIDEAANTTSLLLLLGSHGKLRYHEVRRPVSRGILIDGRYPHNTAVLEEAGGTRWAIDSWPRANGKPPVIMPLDTWFKERRSSVPDA